MAYDDLISKLRSNINNGFTIGMSGKERVSLANAANMEAKLNPRYAADILGQAADDIGFGQNSDNKYSLAAISRLGKGVFTREDADQGFAKGGPIPGSLAMAAAPAAPAPGDDTIISAKTGEYIIPEEVVRFLGIDKLNKLVEGAKAKLGDASDPPKQPQGQTLAGYAQGGLVLDDQNKKPDFATQPFTSTIGTLAQQAKEAYIPNQEQIGATIDSGSSVIPAYNVNSSNPTLGAPLTDTQNNSLMAAWQKASPVTLGQGVNNIPISMGSTEGVYGNREDIKKRSLADLVDTQNATMGLMGSVHPNAEAARLNFRSALNRTDANENIAAVRTDAQRQMAENNWTNRMALAEANHRARLAEIDARQTGGADRPKLRAGERLNANGEAELIPGSDLYIKNSRLHGKDVSALKGLEVQTANANKKIDEVINSPAFSNLFGGYNAYLTNKMPGETQNARAKLESIKSDLKKAGLEVMRSGGSIGMMTEKEWPIVEQMIATIDPKMGEEAAADTLRQVQSYLGSIQNNAKGVYGETWGGTQFYRNRNTSSPGGSAPSPNRKIARTGTMDGKKVIQYSDGSVEYGQ
jgi:hypothetical protein